MQQINYYTMLIKQTNQKLSVMRHIILEGGADHEGDTMRISASGDGRTPRMDTIASNIANVNTTRTEGGGPTDEK